MKLLRSLAVLLLALMAGPSLATISHVSGQNGVSASATGTASKAFTGNVTAGNLLTVVALAYGSSSITWTAGNLTKSAGTATIGTVSVDKQEIVFASGISTYFTCAIFSVVVTGSGSLTLQATNSNALQTTIIIDEDASTLGWDAGRAEATNSNSATTGIGTGIDTGNATSAGNGLFVAALAPFFNVVGTVNTTPDGAFTLIGESTNNDSEMVGNAIRRIVSAGTTDSGTWAWDVGNVATAIASAVVVYKEVAPAVDPTLTDVNTTEVVTDAQTSVAVTGTDMGANNAARTFTLRRDAATSTQTETGSGTATAATLTIAQGNVRFGAGAALRVTRGADSAYGEISVTLNPPSGQLYVDIGTPDPTSAYRITASGDIASGDQIQARGVGSGAAPTGLSIYADGTFGFSSGNTPASFDVRVWSSSDSTWGSYATQTVSNIVIPVFQHHYQQMGFLPREPANDDHYRVPLKAAR